MIFDFKNDYLNSSPAVPLTAISELVQDLRSSRQPVAHGVNLANLIRLCFECALKSNELVGLSVGDVFSKGNPREMMRLGKTRKVNLSGNARPVVEEQISHLRDKGFKLYSSSPLFPDKKKKPYISRILRNDLKPFFLKQKTPMSLEKIRQSAICHYYEMLKLSGSRPLDCLSATAKFANIQIRNEDYRPIINKLWNTRPHKLVKTDDDYLTD